ncbi:protein-glutamate O-methyltransferase CheR [Puteibacter caeruleilacunae]|nr:protein-glutamate O-methyltransferase CheR [Puteibacter caeruleilacunae]
MNDQIYTGKNLDLLDIELQLLLEAIHLKYGYDFRNYSKAHVKRRILHKFNMSSMENITQMQERLLWDKRYFAELINELSINVTEMFRDPAFYKSFRENVVPVLKTYAFIKVWHAGCATGEEVYSLAILLKEEGLLERAQIYATDFNRNVLEVAKQGIYSNDNFSQYSRNYKSAGGKGEFSDYFTSRYGSVMMDKSLTKKVVFADHNLVTDSVFAEVNLIICRNVMIYFNRELQNKVVGLFYKSLSSSGYLCLGTKESLRFGEHEQLFQAVDPKYRIYKKRII